MLRSHLRSTELLRGLFNPVFRRNLSKSSTRYADEKDGRKADGMFSWLKDMLKPGDTANEIQNAIDREVAELDYLPTDQMVVARFEHEETVDQNPHTAENPYANPSRSDSTTVTTACQTDAYGNLPIFDPELEEKADQSKNQYCPSLTRNNGLDVIIGKQSHRTPFLRYDVLTRYNPVRTIVGCTPRNTKPPIREPNMPKKQEKKEEKKEKKQKKPVIRMEGGLSESYEKGSVAEAESKLHDNLHVNFQNRWGIRLPEEVNDDQQLGSSWNNSEQRTSKCFVGDSNFSSCKASYDANSNQTMKSLEMSMSSSKKTVDDGISDSSTKENSTNVRSSSGSMDKSTESENSTPVESLKKILKTSPNMMSETNMDEDYNVPSNTTHDAELSAWKDLVMKSKVPVEVVKEEFVKTEGHRRVDMLSIRPEPPQPKLDVQAVPTSTDEAQEAEEEPDVSKELKGNLRSTDFRRISTTSDIQKQDSKKLHTGSFYFLNKNSNRKNEFKRRLKLHKPSRVTKPMDTNDGFFSSNFSSNVDDSWENPEQKLSKRSAMQDQSKDQLQDKSLDKLQEHQLQDNQLPQSDRRMSDRHSMSNRDGQRNDVPESISPREASLAAEQQYETVNYNQQNPLDSEAEFVDSLNAIADKEMEISLNRSQDNTRHMEEHSISSQRNSRKYDAEDQMSARSGNFQNNMDYSNSQYEDDFYPGYESMSMEPVMEKPPLEKKQQQLQPAVTEGSEQPQTSPEKEILRKDVAQNTNENLSDGNYIKVPGDPYPYSREHFNKWRLQHDEIPLGPLGDFGKDILDPHIDNPNTAREMDRQQPARKMSHWTRA